MSKMAVGRFRRAQSKDKIEIGRSSQPNGHRDLGLKDLFHLLADMRGTVLTIAVISLIVAGMSLVQPLLMGRVISGVETGGQGGAFIWLLVGILFIAGLLGAIQHYLLLSLGEHIAYTSRKQLVGRIFRFPMLVYQNLTPANVVSRLSSDTTVLKTALAQSLSAILGGIVICVGAFVAMIIIDLPLVAVTLFVILLSLAVVFGLGVRIQGATTSVQKTVAELASNAERTLRAIRVVRSSNATEREEVRILRFVAETKKEGLNAAKITAMVSPVSTMAMQISFLAVLGLGGYRVAAGVLTVSQLVAFILYMFMMVMPLNQCFEAIVSLNQALGAYSRLRELLDIQCEDSPDVPEVGSSVSVSSSIEFRNVNFDYQVPSSSGDSPNAVLRDVSFRVEPGTTFAIVGPSGAGKSTILQLIERFYEVSSGSIYIGNLEITKFSRDHLRSLIGYVEQDATALSGTIRENIALGMPNVTNEECFRVLRTVNLETLVARSKDGLDAELGPEGVTLSGGERQRLAVARALIANPPILLLDESTSSLDADNEHLMKQAIINATRGRTVIVVAHRLSTVVDADQIMVLENGQVKGLGNHAQLVAGNSLYKRLAERQLLA